MPSVFIKTYGCQMNERDSEAVAAQLVAKGYALAPSEGEADIILLNTCSVRDAAEQKALNKMRNLIADTKRRRPDVRLGFLGCMAQARGPALIDRLPDLDLVVGTQKFHRVGEYLDDLQAGRQGKICEIGDEEGSEAAVRNHLFNSRDGRTPVKAYVSIMQGCNQQCTFCIVPTTRGPERSRAIEDIVGECQELAARGTKEVTLLGQIVTSYARREIPERHGRSPFVQLLEAVDAVNGLERIRFTAPHPKGYGDDLVEAYGRLPKLCEHAHLPVQSGSNRVLKLMHRGYTTDRFRRIVEKLRQVRGPIGISTDLIVGFPGETEADFNDTIALVREVEFDNAYMYKYSPRQDTPAAEAPDQVPQPVKEERLAILMKEVNAIAKRKYDRLVGSRMQVLVEGPSRRNPTRLEGRTRCNRIVVFEGGEQPVGQLADLRIVRSSTFTLYGDW
jgi:tRNA-2-methylthio-N6-dimethylallyladenosine synthase